MTAGPAAPERAPNAESEAFLAMAVHELRGTAGVVVGAAQMLERVCRDVALPAEARELIQLLDQRGRHLSELIADLLTSAYLTHGSIPLVLTREAMHPLISRAVAGPDEWDGHLLVDCDRDLVVTVDASRLEHVLHNLVVNAFEHGEAPVRVRVQSSPAAEGLTIIVSDRGNGVDPDEAAHLFERFSPLAARRSASTGLGLSIARGLARAMGGDLVYERLDPGSRFVLTLPDDALRNQATPGSAAPVA
jgi:two-component system sensor histidine kinase MtrB